MYFLRAMCFVVEERSVGVMARDDDGERKDAGVLEASALPHLAA